MPCWPLSRLPMPPVSPVVEPWRLLGDLAAQRTGQKAELRFQGEDEDAVLSGQCNLYQFLLGQHRLAGIYTQAERIAVEQPGAVGHAHVFVDGVQPVVDAARLQNFIGTERNQDNGAFGGESAQGFNAAQTVREYGVEAVLLLTLQRGDLAQMFAPRRIAASRCRYQAAVGCRPCGRR